MSAKNVDRKNRFRSITVGFRVSPEEQEELNRAVALSGPTSDTVRHQGSSRFSSRNVMALCATLLSNLSSRESSFP